MLANAFFPWQQQNLALLKQYLSQDKIPQALLIYGIKGLGKQQLALNFIQALLCPQRQASEQACGHCTSCTFFNAHTHPDFMTLRPKKDTAIIGIDAMRELIIKLRLTPQFDAYRVVLIHPAHQLNSAAANAFLKCLEEPNERTCFILLAERISTLPATILSRCQKMLVPTPNRNLAHKWLNEQQLSDHHHILLNLAQGAPLLAQKYAEMNYVSLRYQCFNEWITLANTENNLLEIAEKWETLPIKQVFFWMISWVVDVIKCAHQAHVTQLSNPDLHLTLQQLSHQVDLNKLYHFYDQLLQNQAQLDTQINLQLMLEALLIFWTQLNQGTLK